MRDELKLKVSLLPECPGVYRYLNKDGAIIYVGKAKNLKRRVSSYFNRVHPVYRTNMLVRNIWDMQYTVVNTEEEALDLENSLIKEFQPHYNVLLKDDKSYPWICVTKEAYPRVFLTRDPLTKGAKYYGPYPKTEVAHALIDTLRKLYPLRTCRHNVSRETIDAHKHRLCLQYHIHNCEGCCQGLVTTDQYGEYITAARQILNGDTKQVSDYLQQQMQQLASELKFEEAEVVKRKYLLLEKYRARSVIVNPSIHNIDVFAIVKDDDAAFVNYMHMRGGAVVQSLTLEYRLQDDSQTDAHELMSMAIQEVRRRFADTYANDRVTEVLVNVMPDVEFTGFQCITPQRGDKRKSNAVASCVVFRDTKPCKKDYRHFLIKEAPAGDDYAAMREVIGRRYRRMLDEEQQLPQLVVVDGGKGQLSAAIEALDELGVHGTIAAIGMAKQLNEVYFPGDELPFFIDKNSESLRVIQRLRDEAHRFAITFHRQQRGKSQLHSVLDEISGVGPKTKELLLKHFKSLKRIREASLDDLVAIIGPKKAQNLFNELKNK